MSRSIGNKLALGIVDGDRRRKWSVLDGVLNVAILISGRDSVPCHALGQIGILIGLRGHECVVVGLVGVSGGRAPRGNECDFVL